MTTFELWVKGCNEFDTEIYRMDGEGDTGLYVTKQPYEYGNSIYYKAPIYHVWIEGHNEISTTALYEAQARWMEYKNKTKGMNDMAKKSVDEAAVAAAAEQKEKEEAALKEQIQKNRELIITMLTKYSREGMDLLIKQMDEIGFFTAPASSANHCHYPGGLAQHSLNVMQMAEKIGVAVYGGEGYNKVQESVVVAALLHDLGKCGDYDKHLYIENVLKSGNVSEAKPWKRNKNLIPTPHGMKSYDIANRYIDLAEDEEAAIKYHDGFFEGANVQILKAFSKIPQLLLIIHWADMWSAQVLEDGTTSTVESED